jgi:hypothetical protein
MTILAALDLPAANAGVSDPNRFRPPAFPR